MTRRIHRLAVLLALGCAALAGTATAAQETAAEEKETGWKDTAELAYVLTDGNAESSTLGFKNTLSREWARSLFTLRAGGTRVETTTLVDEFAVGTVDDFSVVTIDEEQTTAENYFLDGRYDRKITEAFFWYAGAGWDRNRPSGIENRYTVGGGVGNIWLDGDDVKFRTSYGLTYTDQENVVDVPGSDDSFTGARLSSDYQNKFGKNTLYQNLLVMDANLEETSDWRGDMINSLAVSMTSHLALKVSLQWLYDNEPAFKSLTLAGGPDDGATVFVELEQLDTIFTTSLAINF